MILAFLVYSPMFYKQLNIIFGVSLYICDTLLAQLRNKADLKVKGERIAQLSTLHCALPVPLPVPVPASGGTLRQDNCQLIGQSLIVLARQAQKDRN